VRLVVTRSDYFDAAMKVLASEGHSALKIGPLCRAIGVTTGSFYNYFGGWDGFVEALLREWEQRQTQRIVVLASAPSDPVTRIRALKKLVIGLPHDAETAIRAWSHTSDAIAAVQRRVDEERRTALQAFILDVVPNRRRAELLAVLGMSLLIGVQQWRTPVDPKELGRLLDEYEATIVAHATALAS
jgi:AcrR family transcriptional regulator